MKTPRTQRQAWRMSLEHWRKNCIAEAEGKGYSADGTDCALCAYNHRGGWCPDCILYYYQGCECAGYNDCPWADVIHAGRGPRLEQCENMYLVLLLIGLSEGWCK